MRCNEHNHLKVFIFDDECVYVDSANITDAVIGKRASGSKNHEAGMLVWGVTGDRLPQLYLGGMR